MLSIHIIMHVYKYIYNNIYNNIHKIGEVRKNKRY